MTKLTAPTAVVCHDAGAANLIVAWLKEIGLNGIRAYMSGPAKKIWQNSFPKHYLCNSLDEVLSDAASLISGTGWSSDVEYEARLLARARGIYTVGVLDHWVNYSERFIRGGRIILPDEIWVYDNYAFTIAQEQFPDADIRILENLYLNEQLNLIGSAPNSGCALYVLEPVRSDWGKGGQGEFQALDFALSKIDDLSLGRIKSILLRPHPSETFEKYSHYLSKDSRISFDTSFNLSEAISNSDIVIGVESFALVVALEAGRAVYSSLPPWAPSLRLPNPGIKQIRHLF